VVREERRRLHLRTAGNISLDRLVDEPADDPNPSRENTKLSTRLRRDRYKAKSWSKERRVCARIEPSLGRHFGDDALICGISI
jgi:hypothetical protein